MWRESGTAKLEEAVIAYATLQLIELHPLSPGRENSCSAVQQSATFARGRDARFIARPPAVG